MTSPASLRPTRRAALVATLVALTATGCEAITSDSPTAPGTTGSRPDDGTDTPADPDEALVADVRDDLATASVLVTSALVARPGLTDELAPFNTLHARHLRALESDRPRARTPVRGDAAAVRGAVRAREAQLRAALADAAVAADSGSLAALLASMSAAVAQQLAAGPR